MDESFSPVTLCWPVWAMRPARGEFWNSSRNWPTREGIGGYAAARKSLKSMKAQAIIKNSYFFLNVFLQAALSGPPEG